jgi:predicted DNA-binding protein with PD1-like motif
VVLADDDFKCVGGHLVDGTIILVAELYGTPLSGEIPVRKFDEATGLALWPEG